MSIESITGEFPAFAKDIKLNLSAVLKPQQGLSQTEIAGIALACGYSTQSGPLITALEAQTRDSIDDATRDAAKAAATIMAMTNVYYRFTHLVNDDDYARLPAGLRMNILANPGVDKILFEQMSLAVSALSGCGQCINAHVKQLHDAGMSKTGIAHVIRIAAVINATAQAFAIN